MRRLTIFLGVMSITLLPRAQAGWPDTNRTVATVVFGSCNHQSKSQAFWKPILDAQPDLFIFAGDNIYADTYRDDLKRQKYAQLGAEPGYQRLKSNAVVVATWDDHDFGLNDSGGEFPEKVASQRAFQDFFEIPEDHPARTREGVYDAYVFGPPGRRVQVILLDTRYHRSPLRRLAVRQPGKGRYRANHSRSATVLGEAQWKWLEQELKKPAEVRLLVSSIQVVAQDHDWEKWNNFPMERTRLYRLIRETGAEGLIILSGDRHHGELSRMSGVIGYPLYDLTSSGLNMAHGGEFNDWNRYRVGGIFADQHIGLVRIDWEAPDPLITLELQDLSGRSALRESIPLNRLRRAK